MRRLFYSVTTFITEQVTGLNHTKLSSSELITYMETSNVVEMLINLLCVYLLIIVGYTMYKTVIESK